MKKIFPMLLLCILMATVGCKYMNTNKDNELRQDMYRVVDSRLFKSSIEDIEAIVETITAGYDAKKYYPETDILNPYNESLFPRDFAAPLFRWDDRYFYSNLWLITIRFASNSHSIYVLTDKKSWIPDRQIWEVIKSNSLEQNAFVTIMGVDTEHDYKIITKAEIAISTSQDNVGAPLMYVQMPLPFGWGREHPEQFLWRFGAVSSYDPPPVVLKNVSFCGNCHHFSRDGKIFGMDIDYRGDKGGYAVSKVGPRMVLTKTEIMSWNDFNKGKGRKS